MRWWSAATKYKRKEICIYERGKGGGKLAKTSDLLVLAIISEYSRTDAREIPRPASFHTDAGYQWFKLCVNRPVCGFFGLALEFLVSVKFQFLCFFPRLFRFFATITYIETALSLVFVFSQIDCGFSRISGKFGGAKCTHMRKYMEYPK